VPDEEFRGLEPAASAEIAPDNGDLERQNENY